MGFLNWFQNNKPAEDSQLDLFGNSQELARHERVDGATVNKDFNKSIKDSGGSDRAYPRSVQAETKKLFDCDVDTLYEETGGRKGDRSTLPTEAQKAYIVNETLSAHVIRERKDDYDEMSSQKLKDDAIVGDVEETASWVRRWLPW